VSHSIPTATPGINQHSSLHRLTSCPPKKKKKKPKTKKLNNIQGTEKEHATEVTGCYRYTGERGRGKELIPV
jgi:hypothetical protein